MSGPKVITYTMKAFKGRLKELMQLQSDLAILKADMQMAQIHDSNLNIHFDLVQICQNMSTEIEKNLSALVFDYKGNIDKKTYDAVESKINERINKIEEVIKKSENILSDFNNKKNDYQSYLNYLEFVNNAKESFKTYKKSLTENTLKNFSKDNQKLCEKTVENYESILPEEHIRSFEWGFDNIAENEKNSMFSHFAAKEECLREIRRNMLDKILVSEKNKEEKTIRENPQSPVYTETMRILQKIQVMTDNCNDRIAYSEYILQLNNLKQSKSMDDLYFYQELHDRILEKEITRKNKMLINGFIVNLNSVTFEKSLEKEKTELIQKAVDFINHIHVNDRELNEFKKNNEKLLRKNKQLKKDQEVKKKEQFFIKTQIIHNFEKLGYTVLDNLEVIDFENESDFYLQAEGQENVLNIKFKDDGSFRYVFQIPQKKESLSVDQQKMKLHEMQSTCDDFINVLNDLKLMGVDIQVKSDKPIELNSMVTIPETISSKIQENRKTKKKEQVRKMYLK